MEKEGPTSMSGLKHKVHKCCSPQAFTQCGVCAWFMRERVGSNEPACAMKTEYMSIMMFT